MGGTQSTRKITLVNDDKGGVIKLSESLAYRLRGQIEGQQAAATAEASSQAPLAEPFPPSPPSVETTPAPPVEPTPTIPSIEPTPTLSSVEPTPPPPPVEPTPPPPVEPTPPPPPPVEITSPPFETQQPSPPPPPVSEAKIPEYVTIPEPIVPEPLVAEPIAPNPAAPETKVPEVAVTQPLVFETTVPEPSTPGESPASADLSVDSPPPSVDKKAESFDVMCSSSAEPTAPQTESPDTVLVTQSVEPKLSEESDANPPSSAVVGQDTPPEESLKDNTVELENHESNADAPAALLSASPSKTIEAVEIDHLEEKQVSPTAGSIQLPSPESLLAAAFPIDAVDITSATVDVPKVEVRQEDVAPVTPPPSLPVEDVPHVIAPTETPSDVASLALATEDVPASPDISAAIKAGAAPSHSQPGGNIPPWSIYAEEAHLMVMRLREEKEQEVKKLTQDWQGKMTAREEEFTKMARLSEEQVAAALKDVEKLFMKVSGSPICQNQQEAVMNCYQDHPRQSLRCARDVEQFTQCVDLSRLQSILKGKAN